MLRLCIALAAAALVAGCATTPEASSEAPEPASAPAPAVPAAPRAEPVAFERSYRVEDDAPTHAIAVAYDSSGRLLAVGSDGALITFDARTGEVASRRALAGKDVRAAAIVPGRVAAAIDGQGLVTLALDGDGAPVPTAAPDATALALSKEGLWVALGDASGKVQVRLAADPAKIAATAAAHSGAVAGVAWNPLHRYIATVGADGALRVFSTPRLEKQLESDGHGPLSAVAYAPDGGRIAFGGETRKVLELDAATVAVRTIAGGQPYEITALGYRADGAVLVAGDESCDTWVYDLAPAAPKTIFHGKHHDECRLSSIAFAGDAERFAFGCRPNGLGGPAPSDFAPNLVAEASLDEGVQALAAAEQAALDDLARASPEGATLAAAFRRPEPAFIGDVEVNQSGVLAYKAMEFNGPRLALSDLPVGTGGGGAAGVILMDSAEAPRPPLAALDPATAGKLAAAEKARAEKDKAIAAGVARLRGGFRIPEWRLAK